MSDKKKKAAAQAARVKKEKLRKKYKKNILIASVIAVVLIAAIVIILVSGNNNQELPDGQYTEEEWQELLQSVKTAEPMQVIEPTAGVTLAPLPVATPYFPEIDTLDPEKMEKKESSGLTFPYVIPEMDLTLLMIDGYSGPYIEDGSNSYVENCTAILVKNTGDTVLEYAELTFKINGEEDAVFKISMLPENSCAMVLEANKLKYNAEDLYMVASKGKSRIETLELNADKIAVTGGEKQITINNRTDTPYSKVVVCYKNLYMEGLYFGGIAYARTFENLAANGEMTLAADNYYPDVCQILKVDVYE